MIQKIKLKDLYKKKLEPQIRYLEYFFLYQYLYQYHLAQWLIKGIP